MLCLLCGFPVDNVLCECGEEEVAKQLEAKGRMWDIENPEYAGQEPNDRLKRMFDLQVMLIERISKEHGSLKYGISQDVTAIIAELGEILEHNQTWKHWRTEIPPIDRKHQLEEIADVWHFVIQLTLRLGYSAEELYDAYIGKNKENFDRQDRGY